VTTLHMVAQTYGRRPSEIVGIRQSAAAYQFDVAVLAAVSTPTEVAPDKPAHKDKYVVPANLPVRRMAIPADGVW
jgi:hypothetical protein